MAKRKPTRNKPKAQPISLHPLSPEEALKGLLQVKPKDKSEETEQTEAETEKGKKENNPSAQ